MSQYLVFQLHGPMASWGVDAPARSVIAMSYPPVQRHLLGLLGGGIRGSAW